MGFLPGTGDGIGLEGSVIQHIPAEGQFLPFLGLCQIAHGEICYRVMLVEGAGQQIRHPIHAAGVVHVAIAVKVAEAHRAGSGSAHGAQNQAGGMVAAWTGRNAQRSGGQSDQGL